MPLQMLTPSRLVYLSGRASASAGALVFAFLYSSNLGLVNRSLIAFVMTSNALILITLTSGTTLTLRKLKPGLESGNLMFAFIKVTIIEMALGLLLYLILLVTYSAPRNNFASNLIFMSVAYFLCSGLHLIACELLIAYGNFRFAGVLELTTILIQITAYLIFSQFEIISIAMTLLFSFCISYLIVFFTVLLYFLHLRISPGEICSIKDYWANTRGSHTLGGLLGFMDRSDRLFIGYFFPTVFLGQYAVMSTLLSVFRFLPDSLAKFAVYRGAKISEGDSFKARKILLSLLPLALIMIILSQSLIRSLLGADWLLPWYVSVFFIIQEIIRGRFQIVGNIFITSHHKLSLNKIFWNVPALGIAFGLLLAPVFGISGVPIAFAATFAFGMVRIRREATSAESVDFNCNSNIQQSGLDIRNT